MSKITDFYLKTGTDSVGRNLDEILEKRYDWMEATHDYIQWMFPTKEPSNFNPDAPLLTDEDIEIFKTNINAKGHLFFNVFDAVDKFLLFLGIEPVYCFDGFDGQFELSEEFESRKYTWLEFNHNALRITRMFTFLQLLGFGKSDEHPNTWLDYGHCLLNFMKKTAIEQGVPLSERTLRFWTNAVEGLPNP